MKQTPKIILTLITIFLLGCTESPKFQSQKPQFAKFEKIKITDIKPQGWIKEFLQRQSTGLTGNIEVAGYPFNTCLWACEKMEGSTKAWWPYEQTAYYIDGIHRLGHLLGDENLLAKADVNMDYVMSHIDSTGRIGINLADRWWRWPYASFMRNYMTNFSVNENQEVIKMMQNHYLTFEAKDFADDLELANVEELCWIYGITKDERLLNIAEEAYRLFKSDLNNRNRAGADMDFASDRKPDHHGVVYLELVKIPAILYSHTGNQTYLDEALKGIQKMESNNMLVSGLPSTTEHFSGISETAGVETCNAAVLPYTYGYFMRITGDATIGDKIEKAVFNGGIGAVTKDFKAHQYFTAPNQFLATSTSNLYGHNPARMAYLPGHDVECCTGNVNRFMPYYVEQMWLKSDDNGLIAALLGPSSVTTSLGKSNFPVTVTSSTKYPFEERIEYQFSMKEASEFTFSMRIPDWTFAPSIQVNGKILKGKIKAGTFHNLSRTFADGDVITLNIPMEIKTSEWPNQGIAVERGPLAYSLPIADERVVRENYEDRSTQEFPGWEITPTGNWNYALASGEMTVNQQKSNAYPWDEGAAPIKIKVPVQIVNNWKLVNQFDEQLGAEALKTPKFPEQLELNTAIEYVELVPYGSTMLRLTVFPSVRDK